MDLPDDDQARSARTPRITTGQRLGANEIYVNDNNNIYDQQHGYMSNTNRRGEPPVADDYARYATQAATQNQNHYESTGRLLYPMHQMQQ